MQCGESAEHRRVVILDSCRDAEETGLEVADEVDEVLAFDRLSCDLRQRAHERDRQRRRAAEAGAARCVGARGDADAGEMEMFDRAKDQRRFRIGGEVVQRFVALLVLLIGEVDRDRRVRRFADFRFGVKRDRDVHRSRAGMEQIERPEIEGASGQIGAHGRANGNLFHDCSGAWC
jgi:hypothetical protein